MKENLYPMTFIPVYKNYIWGGRRIPEKYRRREVQGVCAESWEVADRAEGMSVVANGKYRGQTLREAIHTLGAKLVGTGVKSGVFPLLVKIIDARERLSVQVHPDERAAARGDGEAKTEVWHVLDAAPGAFVFAGLKRGVGRVPFLKAMKADAVAEALCLVRVRTGDTVFIPGGRVHAIGEGCLLLEVQQNSNTTYRVYDWGRMGHDGKPRELHIERALRAIRWKDSAPVKVRAKRAAWENGCRREQIVDCPYFHMERLSLRRQVSFDNDGASFHILFVVSGGALIFGGGGKVKVNPGVSVLLPAGMSEYCVKPTSGVTEMMRIGANER